MGVTQAELDAGTRTEGLTSDERDGVGVSAVRLGLAVLRGYLLVAMALVIVGLVQLAISS